MPRNCSCFYVASCVFPSIFLTAQPLRDTVIFHFSKRGDPDDPNNYHPVSLTHFISKVFQVVLFDHLRSFLKRDCQCGFRFRHSTGRLLRIVALFWPALLANHEEPHLVSLNISKTFHRVCQEGLLSKLTMFGFSPSVLFWASSLSIKQTISPS